MNIGEEKGNGVTIITIDGRVDGLTAPDLRAHVTNVVERGDVRLLLDCAGMTYVSSAGLHVILLSAKMCQENGGKLTICSLQPDCRTVVETGGFHTIIDCHGTREEALAAT